MSRSEKRRKREERERLQGLAVTQIVHARRTRSAVEEAAWLMENGHWRDARRKLEECDRLNPGQRNVNYLLAEVYQHDDDCVNCARICERMLAQNPGERMLHLLLAQSYIWIWRPLAAQSRLQSFLERWPDDMNAGAARKMLASLERDIAELLSQAPFPEIEKRELAMLHEEALSGISTGDFERTIQVASRLLARRPEFVPAMNNLAAAYHETGRIAEATEMSQRVLACEPENVHALANLAQQSLRGGRPAEAQAWGEKLRSAPSVKMTCCAKKAEAFSFLGDDPAVIEAFEKSQDFDEHETSPHELAMLKHLAAVAYARQGANATAVRLWKQSLKLLPEFDLARDNLDDAELPIGKRHGPWPFSFNYWIGREMLTELIADFARRDSNAGDSSDDECVARILARLPQLPALIPLLLERGNELACTLASRLAKAIGTPECVDALRTFCRSNRGPDQIRLQLATELAQQAQLPAGPFRLCTKGESKDLELLGYDLTDEPIDAGYSHPETSDRLADALVALRKNDGTEGERLLRKCLSAEGDRPELLYNLAAAFTLQRRMQASRELGIQIHARWPDYFFGRTLAAMIAAEDGEFDRAESLLVDLRRQRRMHHTEFTALCQASIRVLMLQEKIEVARNWLQIWDEAQPGHPEFAHFERQLNNRIGLHRVKGWWPFGKEKQA